jgi:hypothetical protein
MSISSSGKWFGQAVDVSRFESRDGEAKGGGGFGADGAGDVKLVSVSNRNGRRGSRRTDDWREGCPRR